MTPRGEPRERKFTLVISDDERAMLDALAEADGRTASDWLRFTIRTAHEARFGVSKKKPKK